MEYYGVLGKENNAIFEYLKSCEKALLDLLNEFNEKGEKENTYNLTKENEKLQEKIKELEDDLFEALRIY